MPSQSNRNASFSLEVNWPCDPTESIRTFQPLIHLRDFYKFSRFHDQFSLQWIHFAKSWRSLKFSYQERKVNLSLSGLLWLQDNCKNTIMNPKQLYESSSSTGCWSHDLIVLLRCCSATATELPVKLQVYYFHNDPQLSIRH